MNKVEKRYRVVLCYRLDETYVYSLPAATQYEAELIATVAIFTNSLREKHTGKDDCKLYFGIEKYNEERETWGSWYVDNRVDEIIDNLLVGKPNPYKSLKLLMDHMYAIEEMGFDETVDYDEVSENWDLDGYEDEE